MNRFQKKSPLSGKWKKIKLATIGFVVSLAFFLYGITSISSITLDKQEESLKTAINRSVIQCYAVEGTYPPSLSYLTEHYGLTYDTSLFFVDYESIGSNMMPDITIIRKP